jgi:hypothetical protein
MNGQPHADGRVFNIDPDVRTSGRNIPVAIERLEERLFPKERPPP